MSETAGQQHPIGIYGHVQFPSAEAPQQTENMPKICSSREAKMSIVLDRPCDVQQKAINKFVKY